MNDEIKEILEQLEWYRKIGKKDVYYPECVLPNKKAFILLDYITNLQQQLHQASLDIQELTERDIECPSWCDKLTNLQQENERLFKEKLDIQKDLTNKIYKAIKFIKDTIIPYGDEWHWDDSSIRDYIVDLLNMLQNGSEE